MKKFSDLAQEKSIEDCIAALKANGIDAEVVDSSQIAKQRITRLIPNGSEVMNMTSVTLDKIGLSEEIVNSGNYKSVRSMLNKMDRNTQSSEMQKLGAAPDWVIGSVHAVTKDGKVVVASNTGSQLPAYAYGSSHVI